MASFNHATAMADSTNGTSFTTASFIPVADELIVAFVAKTASIVPGTLTDSEGGTYAQVHIVNKDSGNDEAQAFVRTSLLPSAAAMTLTYDCTGDTATGCLIFVARLNSMARAGASSVRQYAGQSSQGGGTTPAPDFSMSCLTGNPTIGFVFNQTNPAGMTSPTDWSELTADIGISLPTAGAEYVIRNSGFTGTTITWGSTSASNYCDIILEFDTTSPPTRRILSVS